MVQNKKDYRWDIQGLRALAVIAVIIFHINPLKLPGGFLGVDIFFVISGFLIIGFIWRDLEKGNFTLIEFYSKRVKRLFPAFFVTAITCSVLVYKFFLPTELKTFSLSLISSLSYVSNFFFYSQSDYFGPDLEIAPLLHTWSLSVEEQFYLLFPALMLLIHKTKGKKIIVSLSAIALISFVFSESWVQSDESFAFFATPSRFWQFIAGGLVALSPTPKKIKPWVLELFGSASLFYLFYSFFSFNKHTPFPGINAILPTLATVILLFVGLYKNHTSKFLSNPIAIFTGKISYSLYLWHWPVIVFYKVAFLPQLGKNLTAKQQIFIFSTSILLGYLSWRFVENRAIQIKHTRGSFKPIAFTLAISALFCSIAFYSLSGLPNRFNKQQQEYASFLDYKKNRTRKYEELHSKPEPENYCFLSKKNNKFEIFDQDGCINHQSNKNNILIIGDSHADHWVRGFKNSLDTNSTLSVVISSGCRPYLNSGKNKYCTDLFNWGFNELISTKHFQQIYIGGRWEEQDFKPLKEALNKIKDKVDQIFVFGPIIEYSNPLPKLLAFHHLDEIYNYNLYAKKKKLSVKFQAVAKEENINFISLVDLICPSRQSCQILTKEGTPLQYDYGHLTDEASFELVKKSGLIKRLNP